MIEQVVKERTGSFESLPTHKEILTIALNRFRCHTIKKLKVFQITFAVNAASLAGEKKICSSRDLTDLRFKRWHQRALDWMNC